MSLYFKLDLSEVELYGWEDWKLTSRVDPYRQLIRQNMEAPPVPVVFIGENESGIFVYTLDYGAWIWGMRDGGHTRAKAHLLEREPLPCYYREGGVPVPLEKRILIADIILLERLPA